MRTLLRLPLPKKRTVDVLGFVDVRDIDPVPPRPHVAEHASAVTVRFIATWAVLVSSSARDHSTSVSRLPSAAMPPPLACPAEDSNLLRPRARGRAVDQSVLLD